MLALRRSTLPLVLWALLVAHHSEPANAVIGHLVAGGSIPLRYGVRMTSTVPRFAETLVFAFLDPLSIDGAGPIQVSFSSVPEAHGMLALFAPAAARRASPPSTLVRQVYRRTGTLSSRRIPRAPTRARTAFTSTPRAAASPRAAA